jgi:hypothetical protein
MVMFMCEFCQAYFNGLVWKRITSNAYCQKNQTDNFEATFVANGQLSGLITQGWLATDNFLRLF